MGKMTIGQTCLYRLGGALAVWLLMLLATAPLHAVSDENKALMKKNFESADLNGDTSLTEQEFQVFIDFNADDELGQAARIRRLDAYTKVFRKLDQDENSGVSWLEVVEGQGN